MEDQPKEQAKKSKKASTGQYVKIDFETISEYQNLGDNLKLNAELIQKFQRALNTIAAYKTPPENDKEGVDFQTYTVGTNMLKLIQQVVEAETKKKNAKKPYDSAAIDQLNQALFRCSRAILTHDKHGDLAQIALLSREVSGAKSYWSKGLSLFLYTFATACLVAGILAAIPSGGGSLLVTAFAAAHWSAAAAAIASAASSAAHAIGFGPHVVSGVVGGVTAAAGVGIGVGNYYAGLFKDSGVSKEMAKFNKKLVEERNPKDGESRLPEEGESDSEDYLGGKYKK